MNNGELRIDEVEASVEAGIELTRPFGQATKVAVINFR